MSWTAPPNWPQPPAGWVPPPGWKPDPAWGPAPADWNFYPVPQRAPEPAPGGYGYMDPPAPGEQHSPVDNTWAWLLAAAPLLLTVLDAVLYAGGFAAQWYLLSIVVTLVAYVALALADQPVLKRAGVDLSVWWALLAPPVYLFKRARRLEQSFAMFAVSLVCVVLGIAGSFALQSSYAVYEFDMAEVESSIKEDADAIYGTGQQVDCPSRSDYQIGATFDCNVTDQEGVAVWRVTVEDDGSLSWRALG